MARTLKSKATDPAPVQSAESTTYVRRGKVDLRKQPQLTDAQLLIRAMAREREAAKTSVSDFYRLCIREEISRKALSPAPHQVLMFSFIDAHQDTVLRMPIGTGKSYGIATYALHALGKDPTTRVLAVSKAEDQAKKLATFVSDYITDPILKTQVQGVFPKLQRSLRPNDPWTSTDLTISRPAGIRHPSFKSVGTVNSIGGYRLSLLLVDDMIDMLNCNTLEARKKTEADFHGRIHSRMDPLGEPKTVVTNTPWDREDLTYHLESMGWPTLQMDIYGNILISNADAAWLHQVEQTLIRPSTLRNGAYRLRAFDPDINERTPLWPERYSLEFIEHKRKTTIPAQFARTYLCEPFDEDTQRCQKSWVEACKKLGLGTSMQHTYRGPNPVFAGLDLAIGTGREHDKTAFFIFELLPNGQRRILWVESGRWSGPQIVDKITDYHKRYGAVVAVETNFGQDFIRQFAQDKQRDLVVKAHNTNKSNKHSIDFGVESVFTELKNEAWIIPCDINGVCDPEIETWINDMLYYQPSRHTGDHLMAAWIGRERARRSGHNDPLPKSGGRSAWASQSMTSGF